LEHFLGILILLLVVIAALLIVLPLLVVLWLIDIPRKVGHFLRFEDRMRWLTFRVVNAEEMRIFRDDYLHIMESEMREENMDRWGLLREIDAAQDQVQRRLEGGEFAISVAGGLAAIVAGRYFGIEYAGVILTLLVIGFSLLVAFRIVITDTLCYTSAKHRNEPIHRLVLMRAWNQGAIRGKGGVAVALLSILVSPGGLGYRKGQELVDRVLEWRLGGFDKWRAE
jgi:hypothetical protein